MDIVPHKTCRRCGKTQPLTDFYREVRSKDGRTSYCASCTLDRVHIYRQTNPGARPKGGPSRNSDHDPVRAMTMNREHTTARYHAYHEMNKERRRQRYKERAYIVGQANARYRRAHRALYRAIQHRRRARERGNGGSFSGQEWMNLKAAYRFQCLCCGQSEPHITLTIDHVLPLINGGKNDILNIQPLCGPCNFRKGRRHIDYRTNAQIPLLLPEKP
jgi:5-methylcytosine-specific restriction endonuclease McrA